MAFRYFRTRNLHKTRIYTSRPLKCALLSRSRQYLHRPLPYALETSTFWIQLCLLSLLSHLYPTQRFFEQGSMPEMTVFFTTGLFVGFTSIRVAHEHLCIHMNPDETGLSMVYVIAEWLVYLTHNATITGFYCYSICQRSGVSVLCTVLRSAPKVLNDWKKTFDRDMSWHQWEQGFSRMHTCQVVATSEYHTWLNATTSYYRSSRFLNHSLVSFPKLCLQSANSNTNENG